MKTKTNKLGCVNPCGVCTLYDKNNNPIGECFDSPNNFAAACKLDDRIVKGVAWYQYFGKTEIFRDSEDIQGRLKWIGNYLEIHKKTIKFYTNEQQKI